MISAQNQLIERLPRTARSNLLKLCECVDMPLAKVLSSGGEAIRYAYFPVAGCISLVTLLDGKPVLEVGMVGREGMVGAQMVLGARLEHLHVVIQSQGSAWRVKSDAFRRELMECAPLRQALSAYLRVTTTQLATSAACLRFHRIGPRLARWLSMTRDRMRSDRFHLTHEFLAYMLGVRRVGITQAAMTLQREGLIEYRRGEITILDGKGLARAACSCYAADTEVYSHLL